jgi:hypothetical protein
LLVLCCFCRWYQRPANTGGCRFSSAVTVFQESSVRADRATGGHALDGDDHRSIATPEHDFGKAILADPKGQWWIIHGILISARKVV